MKFFTTLWLLASFLLAPAMLDASAGISAKNPTPPDIGSLQLTEEDLALLESMGMSKEDARTAMEQFNSMDPSLKTELIQEGERVAKKFDKLVQEGKIDLDKVTNDEDLFNILLQSELDEAAQNKLNEPAEEVAPKPQPEQPIARPVRNTSVTLDPSLLLNEIIEHLASLQQKAVAKQSMAHRLSRLKLELEELTFLLHLLNKKELIAYLTSKEFSKLYKSLEQLHAMLVMNEPKITTELPFETDEIDDPYEILGLSYKATAQDIKTAFDRLKQTYDPDIIEKQLTGLNEKDRARKKKEAFLFFDTIKSAYQSLKDPKEKAQIDRVLKSRIEAKQRAKALSKQALDKIFKSLSSALYDQKITQEIQNLFQKHAPEEKKKVDAWEKEKKETLEAAQKREASELGRAKQTIAQSQQAAKAAPRQKEVGDEFWSKYRVPEIKPAPPLPSARAGAEKAGAAAGSAAIKPTDIKKEEAKKPEAPKGGGAGGKPDGKKDEKAGADDKAAQQNAQAKQPASLDLKDVEALKLLHAGEFEALQKSLKDPAGKAGSTKHLFSKELPNYLTAQKPQAPAPVRRRPLDADGDETDDVLDNAEAFEQQAQAPATPAVQHEKKTLAEIEKFMKQHKIAEISADLSNFIKILGDPKLPKEKKEAYKKQWEGVVAKYKDTIAELWKLADNTLNPQSAPVQTKPIHASQEQFHALKKGPEQDALHKQIVGEHKTLKPGDKGYLGYVKHMIDMLHKSFVEVTKKLGVQAPSAPAQAPK